MRYIRGRNKVNSENNEGPIAPKCCWFVLFYVSDSVCCVYIRYYFQNVSIM